MELANVLLRKKIEANIIAHLFSLTWQMAKEKSHQSILLQPLFNSTLHCEILSVIYNSLKFAFFAAYIILSKEFGTMGACCSRREAKKQLKKEDGLPAPEGDSTPPPPSPTPSFST